MKLRSKVFIGLAAAVVLAGVSATMYILLPRQSTVEKVVSAATFDFDASKAPGWFAGANIDGEATNADAAPTSKKLATTTRIIAQGTAEKPTGNCFVQYSYWADNGKDIDQVVTELSAPSDPSTAGSFKLEPVNTISVATEAQGKDISFQLHQYTITGPDTAQMSTGQEIGAFKAGTGYVDIRGYCKTADELAVTLPVFSAVSLKL